MLARLVSVLRMDRRHSEMYGRIRGVMCRTGCAVDSVVKHGKEAL